MRTVQRGFWESAQTRVGRLDLEEPTVLCSRVPAKVFNACVGFKSFKFAFIVCQKLHVTEEQQTDVFTHESRVLSCAAVTRHCRITDADYCHKAVSDAVTVARVLCHMHWLQAWLQLSIFCLERHGCFGLSLVRFLKNFTFVLTFN